MYLSCFDSRSAASCLSPVGFDSSSESAAKARWQSAFAQELKSKSTLQKLWDRSHAEIQRSSFQPTTAAMSRLETCYQFAAPVMQGVRMVPKTPKKTLSRAAIVELLSKMWFNTLRLFTFEHHLHELGNRNFFDLTRLIRKTSYLAPLVGFTLLNQQAVYVVAQALAISSIAAHLLIVAISVSLTSVLFYAIHRYAVYALKRPLSDFKSSDTENLTALAAERLALSEIGREVDLDDLETALSPSGSIVGLIGEAGTGKSEMAKLLAQRLASGRCQEALKGKQVYLVNGSQVTRAYIEKFKEHIKGHEDEVILVVDEADGIFDGKASQRILKSAWSQVAPRLLFITTPVKYRETFEAEADGSWVSRIQPCLTLQPIDPRAMLSILHKRLQLQLPWIQIPSRALGHFAASGSLRDAIKRIDAFAAQQKRAYHSSDHLIKCKARLQELRTSQADLAAKHSLDELVALEDFQNICLEVRAISEAIEAEKTRLKALSSRLEAYQHCVEMEDAWLRRTWEFWSERANAKPSASMDRRMLACALWASEVFKQRKTNLSQGLQTALTDESVEAWLEGFQTRLIPLGSPSGRKRAAAAARTGRSPSVDTPGAEPRILSTQALTSQSRAAAGKGSRRSLQHDLDTCARSLSAHDSATSPRREEAASHSGSSSMRDGELSDDS